MPPRPRTSNFCADLSHSILTQRERGTFWRGITIESDSRLRLGRAIAKTEEEVADALMAQLKRRGHPDCPPPMATDGKGGYRDALVETWGQAPHYGGRGRPPTRKHAQPDWHYLQVIKHRSGHRLSGVTIKVVYGTPDEVIALVGAHIAYVERTNLTSRQMNGRLVRKTLSFSKQLAMLEAACAWEDWVVGLDPLGQDLGCSGGGWAAAVATALTRHGRRTDRPYLDC